MKFLIIGLGSMGQRRIRCLRSLGYEDIVGCDLREEAREKATEAIERAKETATEARKRGQERFRRRTEPTT